MTDGKRGEPTGLERMKRIPPSDLRLRPVRLEFDPKKAYQKKQLAELGAISIAWNQIEAHIEYMSSWLLFPKSPFYLKIELNSDIRLSKRLALIRAGMHRAELLSDDAKKCIDITLQAILEYGSFRNAVIHHHIYDHKRGIASYINERGKSSQVMVTYEALSGLYRRLDLLKHEIREIDMLFLIEMDGDRFSRTDPTTGLREPCPPKVLREQLVPEALQKVLRYQTERLSLPPLPLFPDARRVRPKSAVAKSRRRSSEKGRKK